jgi:hypothetical protein
MVKNILPAQLLVGKKNAHTSILWWARRDDEITHGKAGDILSYGLQTNLQRMAQPQGWLDVPSPVPRRGRIFGEF